MWKLLARLEANVCKCAETAEESISETASNRTKAEVEVDEPLPSTLPSTNIITPPRRSPVVRDSVSSGLLLKEEDQKIVRNEQKAWNLHVGGDKDIQLNSTQK